MSMQYDYVTLGRKRVKSVERDTGGRRCLMSREEIITMGEMNRYEVMKLDRRLTNKETGRSLQLSIRQIQRIKKRVFKEGVRGVFHGNKGRQPVHKFSAELKGSVIDLVKEKFFDFNFSNLSEYLQEAEAIQISRETLRKWLRAAGLGGKKHRRPAHRKWRHSLYRPYNK
jgi:hypothetical protein